jgi:hypothetical protein
LLFRTLYSDVYDTFVEMLCCVVRSRGATGAVEMELVHDALTRFWDEKTMELDAALQRPTPSLPFAGATGGASAVYVPALDARQYVALRAELALQPALREETRRRYQVPNEAALRALEEQWRHPARRAALEIALADFAVALRGQVLR